MENQAINNQVEKRSIISIVASIFVIICFVLFLFGLMYITVTREKQEISEIENRYFATFPEYTTEGALDGSYFTGIDTYIKDHAALRTTLLKLSTYIDMNVIRRPVVNDVVIVGDILLPFNEYEIVDEAEIKTQAESVATTLQNRTELVDSYGGKYYYVAIPTQYMCNEDKYPWYLSAREEYTEVSSKQFFTALKNAGVDYIDMNEYYEAAGCPDYFTSKVDHHYGILGAYYTYKCILDRVLEDTDFTPTYLGEDDFTIVNMENPYVGSRSKKLFGLWTSDERPQLLYPNTDVPFERYSSGVRLAYDTVYSFPWGDNVTPLEYAVYMGGDASHNLVDTGRDELPSILVYGDSFTNALESIIWYSFDEMDAIDLRHYTDMTIEQFIAEKQPEVVVCVKDYSVLLLGE